MQTFTHIQFTLFWYEICINIRYELHFSKVELNKRRIPFNRSKLNSSNRLHIQHVVWHILCSKLPNGFFYRLWVSKQDRQYTYTCNIEVRSRNHCCRRKAISMTYYECVSAALVTEHATRMRPITLTSVACLALIIFSTLSH